MKKLPQISEAEYEVMKIVWKNAPVSTNEVTETLTRTTDWSPKTIQTMLKRLVNKGALTYVKEGRVFVYTPLVEEEEYISQKSSSFLSRYYDGELTSMVSAYLENDRLSDDEISELRSLLDRSQIPVKDFGEVENKFFRRTNARCPVCHKKMELVGKGDAQRFVCSCGHKEKLSAFEERKKKEGRGANKRDVANYMRRQAKEANEPINSAFADALKNLNL